MRYFEALGVGVEVAEEGEERGYAEELAEDFVSTITSLAARIYGKRSRKLQEIRKCVGMLLERTIKLKLTPLDMESRKVNSRPAQEVH